MSYQSASVLLRLPRELRDAIYMFVFTPETLVRILEHHTRTKPFPALLQTCHQIYSEGYPFFLRSITFVISRSDCLEYARRWFEHKNLDDVRTIAMTSLTLFRTFPPGQKCMHWVQNEGFPPSPVRVGPKMFITGSHAPRATHAAIPKAIRFLLSLSGLQHLEIGIHVKFHTDEVDRAQRRDKHYYDLYSLTAITTLKSLTLICDSRIIARMWRDVCKISEEDRRPSQVKRKEVLDDAWGLRSWMQEAFEEKGLDVEVKCIWSGVELHMHSI
ncbi:hypothetical protein FB567DRAFT_590118 [Paraphoma chrysanthemicola]|uniref:F-box domain-containing protein n=1 Tax=Paraphoma chrysanthemicola TaxID=798071 RepID=A0A8K0RAN7_9PLEO|nr:hypothetical protein FB567DRAFT_590118 [Paraphoma chrysanthemicola]